MYRNRISKAVEDVSCLIDRLPGVDVSLESVMSVGLVEISFTRRFVTLTSIPSRKSLTRTPSGSRNKSPANWRLNTVLLRVSFNNLKPQQASDVASVDLTRLGAHITLFASRATCEGIARSVGHNDG